jgi:hypothetical protein
MQALDFVQRVTSWEGGSSPISKLPDKHDTLIALRTALEQPEQVDCPRCGHVCSQRPWVGLTEEEILDLFDRNNVYGSKWIEFARTVEAKLKEKNK